MKEISIEKVVQLAKKWKAEEKSWHFHMLPPDCMFNKNKEKHAFVLENQSDNQTFVTYSDERYMKQGKLLVQLLHGEAITSKDKELQNHPSDRISDICQRAEELNSKSIQWHHHMLFPNCIFNEQKGKWNIVFEDKKRGELLEATYDSEPTDDLRAVEALYYEQKK